MRGGGGCRDFKDKVALYLGMESQASDCYSISYSSESSVGDEEVACIFRGSVS